MKPPTSLRAWLRQHLLAESRHTLDDALTHEALVSERLRVTLLAGLFGLAWAVMLFVYAFFPGIPKELFRGRLPALTLSLIMGVALGYELLARTVFGHFIRTQRQPPPVARYVNALIETSFPTVLLVVAAHIFDPALALLTPPSLMYFLFILLATLRLDFGLCLFTGAVAAVEYVALAWFYLGQSASAIAESALTSLPQHVGKGVLFAIAGLVAGLVSVQIRRQLANSFRLVEERNRVLGIFGQYVSPAVVDRLLAQEVGLGGEARHVCLMFLDIRDFTTFSEKRRPEEVVHYLNSLFEFMIESVNRHDGIINKFLGDGFMAVFGAPVSDGDLRQPPCGGGRAGNRRQGGRVERRRPHPAHAHWHWPARGRGRDRQRRLGPAQGIHHHRRRGEPGLAHRQLNKQFGSQLLVSEVVWQAVNGAVKDAAPLGPVPVKGHEALVQVYQLA